MATRRLSARQREKRPVSLETPTDAASPDPPEDRPADIDKAPTLAQQVYQALESRIVDGDWLPDTRVSLRTLALSLSTSMQPVREAVGQLVGAKALEMTPGRSIRVPVLDRALADELWSMRLLLEGEAAARFAARRCRDEAHRLFGYTRTLRSFRFGADLKPTMETIMAWNRDLALGSASPILIETIMGLRLRYAPFVAHALSIDLPFDDDFRQFTLHIQDELILAVESGDAAAARHLRCADLRSFQRYLYSRMGWAY